MRALKSPFVLGRRYSDKTKQLQVANRTREIRPSGMRGGLYRNVMQDCCSNGHETGNGGYNSECLQSNHARAVILLDTSVSVFQQAVFYPLSAMFEAFT